MSAKSSRHTPRCLQNIRRGFCALFFLTLLILPAHSAAQATYTLPYKEGIAPDSVHTIAQSIAYVHAIENAQHTLIQSAPLAIDLFDADLHTLLTVMLHSENISAQPTPPYPMPRGDISVSIALQLREDMLQRIPEMLNNTLLLIRQQAFFTLFQHNARQAHKLLLIAVGIQANTHGIDAEKLQQEIAHRARLLKALWLYHTALAHFWDTWKQAPLVEQLLQEAVELAPELALFDASLGEVLLQLDRPSEALTHFNTALDLMIYTPSTAPEVKEMGKISPLPPQAHSENPLELISLGKGRALYMRALGHLRLQQPALAKIDLDAALALEPHNPTWLRARGAVNQLREDYPAMCDDFVNACAFGDCEGLLNAQQQQLCP